jgi:hypothetical protein
MSVASPSPPGGSSGEFSSSTGSNCSISTRTASNKWWCSRRCARPA